MPGRSGPASPTCRAEASAEAEAREASEGRCKVVLTLPAPGADAHATDCTRLDARGSYGDIGQYTLYGYDDVSSAPAAPSSVPGSTPSTTGATTRSASIFSSKTIATALSDELDVDAIAA